MYIKNFNTKTTCLQLFEQICHGQFLKGKIPRCVRNIPCHPERQRRVPRYARDDKAARDDGVCLE